MHDGLCTLPKKGRFNLNLELGKDSCRVYFFIKDQKENSKSLTDGTEKSDIEISFHSTSIYRIEFPTFI